MQQHFEKLFATCISDKSTLLFRKYKEIISQLKIWKIKNIDKWFEYTLYNMHINFFSTLNSLGTWYLKPQEDTVIYPLCNAKCLKRHWQYKILARVGSK